MTVGPCRMLSNVKSLFRTVVRMRSKWWLRVISIQRVKCNPFSNWNRLLGHQRNELFLRYCTSLYCSPKKYKSFVVELYFLSSLVGSALSPIDFSAILGAGSRRSRLLGMQTLPSKGQCSKTWLLDVPCSYRKSCFDNSRIEHSKLTNLKIIKSICFLESTL